jgi:uncharacterized membrane protein
MGSDIFVKALLTIIAGCLVALTLERSALVSNARAAAPTTCTGEMKATGAGPMQASIGSSYSIKVTCN